MEKQDLVSIIMPTYNSSLFIEKTLEAIVAQTYLNWELLITDDCSIDDTVFIIRKYANKDLRIKLFVLSENSGPAIARNESIKQAQGKYIAFCDSDDLWGETKLKQQIDFMKINNYSFTHTDLLYCSYDGQIRGYRKCTRHVSYNDLLIRSEKVCSSVIYDAESLGKFYMPLIRKRQDWALWLQIIKKSKLAHCLHEPLLVYRMTPNSVSSKKIDLVKYNWQVYREIEGFSLFKSFFLFSFCYMPFYLLQKMKKYLFMRRKHIRC